MNDRQSAKKKPLRGIGVLVTRARDQAGPMIRGLEALGADVYQAPTIHIEPTESPEGLAKALGQIQSYDSLIFTSVNGVEIFSRHLKDAGLHPAELPPAICVGSKTADAWRKCGGRVGVLPASFTGEGILSGLDPDLGGRSFLILRPEVVKTDLGAGVRKRGGHADEMVLYRTVAKKGGAGFLRDLLDRNAIQVATFTSPSSIKGISEILGGVEPLRSVLCLCIGPTTAQAASAEGLSNIHFPEEHTVEGMLRLLPTLL
jgi:uroporphyrinogen III methyltransferase/synthase